MKYVLLGNPVPLARPRFGKGRTYDSQRLLKISLARQIEEQHANRIFFKGPLLLEVVFYLGIPKKSSKTNKLCNRPHIYRPDLSNLLKFLEDICINVLYNDDCIISRVDASKVYDHEARTEFTLTPIEIHETESNDDIKKKQTAKRNKKQEKPAT